MTTQHPTTQQTPMEQHPRLRVAISGASGLVGQSLSTHLRADGHTVVPLVRSRAQTTQGIFWDPATQEIDASSLEGMDVVIHLAGENVASGRWTQKQKQRILNSRKQGTQLISETLALLKKPPHTFLSASAIGYYGHCNQGIRVTETSERGQGFLAEVCRVWEEQTQPAIQAGIRVVQMRIGVVLSGKGGALQKMRLPFSLGLGGRIGHGQQGMSWIALDDLILAIQHLIHHPEISGPVNLTAPQPCSQAEFAKTLGHVLQRPTWFPLPAPIVKLLLGDMGQEMLLQGAYVYPQRLLETGFTFCEPSLKTALQHALGT